MFLLAQFSMELQHNLKQKISDINFYTKQEEFNEKVKTETNIFASNHIPL